MSPRPRRTSDEAILTAAMQAIGKVGPARLTLADVAGEAGVSPATLVQRFGSKRGLLLALASLGPEAQRHEYAAIRETHSSPTAALLALADCMARFASTPEEISNGLAFLQMDLVDPDFHRHALSSSEVADAELQRMVTDAIRAGELKDCQPAPLARVIGATLHGSLMGWAIRRQGAPGDWIRKDLETVLAPYRTRGARRSKRSVRRIPTRARRRASS
jgi:AcrR family transcriptional regulator